MTFITALGLFTIFLYITAYLFILGALFYGLDFDIIIRNFIMKDTEVKEFINKRDWQKLSELPSDGSKACCELNEEYGVFGVYQIALKKDVKSIGNNLIHKNIGYTGKSKDIQARTAVIRQPNTKEHGAARYIRQNNINSEDVVVRYFYTKNLSIAGVIEKNIQDKTKEKFGYSFKWKAASDGKDGIIPTILDLFSDLDFDNRLQTVQKILGVHREISELELQDTLNEFIRT